MLRLAETASSPEDTDDLWELGKFIGVILEFRVMKHLPSSDTSAFEEAKSWMKSDFEGKANQWLSVRRPKRLPGT